jgi:hypothetical protein
VLNEVRFGYNSFFNTFGRELAFVRDVVKELGIPGISQGTPESWGIPAIGITGYSGFGDSTEGPYTNRNKVYEFTDNLSWFRGRTRSKPAAASASISTTRWATSSRAARSPSTGGPPDRSRRGHVGRPGVCRLPARHHAHVGIGGGAARPRTSVASSQAYYFTDTWRLRDDMTLDLGVRYEYVPPWLDKGGTLINAYLPYNDTGLPVADLSRHPVLVRIGEGDFYEDSPIRFAPNIKVSRNGELGGRLVNDDKKNVAPRVGWAWTPEPELVGARRRRRLLHAGHRQPALRHGAQRGWRRQDTADPLRLNMNWGAPFLDRAPTLRRPAAARLRVESLRAGQPRTAARRRTWCSTCSTCSASWALHGGGSRLPRLAQQTARADVRRQRGDAGPGGLQDRRPYPEFTKIQEIGNVAEAEYNSMAVKVTRRLDQGLSLLVGYTLSKSEDNGSGIRVLNGDALFPQNSNCFECEWGLSIFDVRHRFVTSLLYELPFGRGKPFLNDGRGRRRLRRLADQRHRQQVERLPARSRGRAPTFPHRIADLSPEPRGGSGSQRRPQTTQQWFNTAAFARPAPAPTGTPDATSSSARHLHHGRVADSQLLLRRDQVAAVPARSLQPVQPPRVGRPADVDGKPALRDHQHYAHPDARAPARREVRVLTYWGRLHAALVGRG